MREPVLEREFLRSQSGSDSCTALYARDPAFRKHILSVLSPIDQTLTVCQTIAELQSLLDRPSVSVVVLALTAHRDQIDAAEFGQLSDALRLLRRRGDLCQGILLTPLRLSLQQSCEAVLAGVAAIIDCRADGFQDRLTEKFLAATRYVAERKLRPQRSRRPQTRAEQELIGNSIALTKVTAQARRAALISDAPVLITGESGTGKQRIAEIIHAWDEKRQDHPFVSVNCAAITGTLAESELFGHKKGAFTGATENRRGYFRAADGGTILLDEVGELTLSLQPKILRVLQEGLVLPVGSDQECRLDVRVIAATNQNLKKMVSAGAFRLDLYQRLNVIQLKVPPLRHRIEDIPLLFEAFLEKYAHYSRHTITGVDPAVYEILGRGLGEGNVRELENVVRQVLAFKECGGRIEIGDLPHAMIEAQLEKGATGARIDVSDELIEAMFNGTKQLGEVMDVCEQVVLERLIKRGLSQTVLAQRLGVTRRTLYSKLEKHRLR